MKKKIVISAYSIHQGGGKILLDALLKSIATDSSVEVTLFLDTRLKTQAPANSQTFFVRPTLLGRIKAEMQISKLTRIHDVLLCFGNLPPLFKSFAKTYVYVQTKYLVSRNFICWTSLTTALRTFAERIWFGLRKSKSYTYFVQTPSMKKDFIKTYGSRYNCEILGFAPLFSSDPVARTLGKQRKLLYIASGDIHKNHINLFKALSVLKTKGLTPQLTLTIDTQQYPIVAGQLEKYRSRHKLEIKNHMAISREVLLNLYSEHDALIFPSYFESFGLPLIEAQQFGLPIIASDLDFVRDVVTPVETFDPHSPTSIADAIERFFKHDRPMPAVATTVKTPEEFLWRLTH